MKAFHHYLIIKNIFLKNRKKKAVSYKYVIFSADNKFLNCNFLSYNYVKIYK